MGLLTRLWQKNSAKQRPPTRPRTNRLRFEMLESRRMLTLLGVTPVNPEFTYDSTGHIQYTASTDSFVLTASPLTFDNVTSPPNIVTTPRGLTVDLEVDNNGNLIAGTSTADDLVINGTVQPNGPSGPT